MNRELLSGNPKNDTYFLIQEWNETMQEWQHFRNTTENQSAHRIIDSNPETKLRVFLVVKEYAEVPMKPKLKTIGEIVFESS
jgi:heme-degrading monooxygenase HmoA